MPMPLRTRSPRLAHLLLSSAIRRRIAVGLLSAPLVASGCGEGVAGPGAETPEALLFVSGRSSGALNWFEHPKDIYRMNSDGSGVDNLTRQPVAHYRSLSLTRDGGRVAYNRLAGCYSIWVMNVDGSDAREVVSERDYRCTYRPRWSPDGGRLAFTSTRDRTGWAVWVTDAQGGAGRNVSHPLELTGSVWAWGWSPEGRVVFHHMREGGITVYTVRPDGTDLKPFFDRAGDHSPAWSPDGSRVAFISDRSGAPRLHVMNRDGSGVRRLSDLPEGEDALGYPWDAWENEYLPWSPDGRSIVFRNLAEGASTLYVVREAGGSAQRLTPHGQSGTFNGWSASGQRIAFTGTGANGVRDIFTVRPDGTGQRNLTLSAWNDGDAVWLPRR
jgi:TolB protein